MCFTDDVALREYLAEVQVQHHMVAANAKQMQKRSARPVSIPSPTQSIPPATQSDIDSAVSLSNECKCTQSKNVSYECSINVKV